MPSNVVNTQTQWREISNSIESMLRWDWQIEAKSSFLTTSLKYRTAFLHRQTQIIVITNSWKCRAKPSPKTSQIVNQYTKTCTFLRLKLQWTRLLDILCCWVFCCALHVLFERVWDVCLYSIFWRYNFSIICLVMTWPKLRLSYFVMDGNISATEQALIYACNPDSGQK